MTKSCHPFTFFGPHRRAPRFHDVTSNQASRRIFITSAISGLAAAACGRPRRDTTLATATSSSWPVAPPSPLSSTRPASRTECALTEDNIEGPFFKAGAPQRAVLANDRTEGTRLSLTGRVLDRNCAPIRRARIEVWHADHKGAYDNDGFGFRAELTADEAGGFALESIIPGRYLNGSRYRPAHVHVKIAAQGHRPLTTQLYFDGDPYNVGDPFIRQSLVMSLRDTPNGKAASYDIVLA